MDEDRIDWLLSLGVVALSLFAYLYLISLAILFTL